jgi:inner membrane protein
MISRMVIELGPWAWWVLGLALLALELMVPGVFLVWIGMAAIATGLLSLALWETGFWIWEVQALVFAALSVASILIGRKIVSRTETATSEPFLNRRGESLVGRTALLKEPIAQGRGRIKLDDTTWSVTGPDMPAGTQVKITASSGRDLVVEKI